MKVAITAQGTGLDDQVDPRFGRASYILIIDSETTACVVIDNSANAQLLKGAGIQTATLIHQHGAQVLLTGYCGPKAFQTLKAAGIHVVQDVSGTISEALESFRTSSPVYSSQPNAEAHW